MIEVFKTDVNDREQAENLLREIHSSFNICSANFDLSDCDKILRIESAGGNIRPLLVIELIRSFGYHAELLQD